MWEPQPLATLRASTACTGIILHTFSLVEMRLYTNLIGNVHDWRQLKRHMQLRNIFDRILQKYSGEDVDSNFLLYNPMASLCDHGN
jgi:hypothetical protein